ncbi:hypothetical protein OIU77_007775 [Salix suchowensis]|uniref:Uncharacterized protein n=1 Tax=Salix suchowensis TaxID=1278906 RepID=A0ABQ9AHE9_9ROSI|nr:hypothetical protein OIU77_007775 [Salix suchowensis]
MGITIGAMLEEIQGLFQQHHQPCFLYLASEVIRDFIARPDIADDCFLLALRCIRYCPQVFIPSTVFPALMDCSMIGITVQHKEASISILTFLSDIFDLAKSTVGEQYLTIRESVIIPRGVTIARIFAVTEVERTNFLQALNDAAFGIDINTLMAPIEELSDVCRRHRTIQDIVQGALRSLELHLVTENRSHLIIVIGREWVTLCIFVQVI